LLTPCSHHVNINGSNTSNYIYSLLLKFIIASNISWKMALQIQANHVFLHKYHNRHCNQVHYFWYLLLGLSACIKQI
jgi:hypothetical protein